MTSRAPLHVSCEHELPVPPLDLPDPSVVEDPEALSRSQAVALFIQRAKAVLPGFGVDARNGPAIAALCHRLDGLPLALELAAAGAKLLSPQALLERLTARLDDLGGGPVDLPERQQTLRGTIAWSCDLLPAGARRLFA